MTEIQFDEESHYTSVARPEQKTLFVRIVLATGIVSSERTAEYVLLVVSGLAIIVAIFFYFSSVSHSPPQPPTPFQEGKLL